MVFEHFAERLRAYQDGRVAFFIFDRFFFTQLNMNIINFINFDKN